MYSHSWVTELSSITKGHILIQFTVSVSYSVTTWVMAGSSTSCVAVPGHQTSSKTVLPFRVILSLPFSFIAFPVTSLSFIICDFLHFWRFFHTGNVHPHRFLLSMPAPDYRMELWEVFPMHALEYKSFSALPKLGMYAKAKGWDWLKVINSVLSPT